MPPPNAVEAGAELFAQRACAACHATSPNTERLGPSLRGIASRLSREEILEEIEEPHKRIKPSLAGIKITLKDGRVVLGRVVNAEESRLDVMVMGNAVVPIVRSEIATTEEQTKSLMPERLLNGLSKTEIDHLVSYLTSLR